MEHKDCVRNYKTSLGKAMEVTATLELIVTLHEQGISVEYIVSDDGSTIRPRLQSIGIAINYNCAIVIYNCTHLKNCNVIALEVYNHNL